MISAENAIALHTRIAVLEAELRHARREVDEARASAHIVLNLLQRQGDSPESVNLRHQNRLLGLENQKLKDKVLQCITSPRETTPSSTDDVLLLDFEDKDRSELTTKSSGTTTEDEFSISMQAMTESVAQWETPSHQAVAANSPKNRVRSHMLPSKQDAAFKDSLPFRCATRSTFGEAWGTPRSFGGATPEIPTGPRSRRLSDPTAGLHGPSRAVLITGLSKDIVYRDLTPNICGGRLLSIQLADTVAITRSMTAFVEFLHHQDAQKFARYHEENPLCISRPDSNDSCGGDQKSMTKIRVQPVETPSSGLLPSKQREILEEELTRCFTIVSPPRSVLAVSHSIKIIQDAVGEHSLVKISVADCCKYSVECTSIEMAVVARDILLTGVMRGFKNWTDPDPCERSLGPGSGSLPGLNGSSESQVNSS